MMAGGRLPTHWETTWQPHRKKRELRNALDDDDDRELLESRRIKIWWALFWQHASGTDKNVKKILCNDIVGFHHKIYLQYISYCYILYVYYFCDFLCNNPILSHAITN